MVMKKASGGHSPLRQGAEKSFWTLPIPRRRWRRLAVYMFSGKLIGSLGFSRRGEYIGGRRCQEVDQRPTPGLGVAKGWPAPWGGCGRPLAPLRLCFGLRLVSGKICTLAFVSSNSENISCVTLLKHKNSIKQGTITVASRK
jgi:hypothetical protein